MRFYSEAERLYIRAWQDPRCRSRDLDAVEECILDAGQRAGRGSAISEFARALAKMLSAVHVSWRTVIDSDARLCYANEVDAAILGTTSRPGGRIKKAWVYIYIYDPCGRPGFYAVLSVRQDIALSLRRYIGASIKISVDKGSLYAVRSLNKAYLIKSSVLAYMKSGSTVRLPCIDPSVAAKMYRGAVVPELVIEAPKYLHGELVPSAAHMLVMCRGDFVINESGNEVRISIGRGGGEMILEKPFYSGHRAGCLAVISHFGGRSGYLLSSFDCECDYEASYSVYAPSGIVSRYRAIYIAEALRSMPKFGRRAAELYVPPPPPGHAAIGENRNWIFDLCRGGQTYRECVLEVYERLGDQVVQAPNVDLLKHYSIEDIELWLREYCCARRGEVDLGACIRLSRSC